MLEVIENYNRLKSNLPQLLDLSGYRMDYIAEQLGFAKNYFYAKKSKNRFSSEEFEKIISFIWKEEFEDWFCSQIIEDKLALGKNISSKEFEKHKKW